MNYADGQKMLIGDIVSLEGGMTGSVAAILSDGLFSDDLAASEWAYLEVGVLVASEEAGLIHYPDPTPGWRLLRRR